MTPHRYAYIDAIRGYAILLVIAVHSSQYFSDLPDAVRTLADQGARGVQLFFVASAFPKPDQIGSIWTLIWGKIGEKFNPPYKPS